MSTVLGVAGSASGSGVTSLDIPITLDVPQSTPTVARFLMVCVTVVYDIADTLVLAASDDAAPGIGYRGPNGFIYDSGTSEIFAFSGSQAVYAAGGLEGDAQAFCYGIVNPLAAGATTITLDTGGVTVDIHATLIAVEGPGPWKNACYLNVVDLPPGSPVGLYMTGGPGTVPLGQVAANANLLNNGDSADLVDTTPYAPDPGYGDVDLEVTMVAQIGYPSGGFTWTDGAMTTLDSWTDEGATPMTALVGYRALAPSAVYNAGGTPGTFPPVSGPGSGLMNAYTFFRDGNGVGMPLCPTGNPTFNTLVPV